jgi:hypothetical protein
MPGGVRLTGGHDQRRHLTCEASTNWDGDRRAGWSQLRGVVSVTLIRRQGQPPGRPALIAKALLAMSAESRSLVRKCALASTFHEVEYAISYDQIRYLIVRTM